MLDAMLLGQDNIDFATLRDCLSHGDWHSATGNNNVDLAGQIKHF
ncbi:MAG: hypothetical protein BMS9Abin26_1719 [Gammaproteobacteria bacterium]|nr:MAG: hypothetical protein BMS9Abin26_1719 [Gammaproteobacteria bacterium]